MMAARSCSFAHRCTGFVPSVRISMRSSASKMNPSSWYAASTAGWIVSGIGFLAVLQIFRTVAPLNQSPGGTLVNRRGHSGDQKGMSLASTLPRLGPAFLPGITALGAR